MDITVDTLAYTVTVLVKRKVKGEVGSGKYFSDRINKESVSDCLQMSTLSRRSHMFIAINSEEKKNLGLSP